MNKIEEKLMEEIWKIIEMFEDCRTRFNFRKEWLKTYKKLVNKNAKYR